MPNQLKLSATTSGLTVYAVVFSASGQFWNTAGTPAFENETDVNWTSYAIALAEAGTTAVYMGNFPAAITTAGEYFIQFRQQADVAPELTDSILGIGEILWTGSTEAIPLSSGDASGINLTFSGALPNVHATGSGGSSGTGSIAIDQNTGGADNLRYVTTAGVGVENANVLIYLATDWPENPANVQATATTGANGRWLAPAFVNTGTYVAVFSKIGLDGPDVSSAFSV
jgi:hypothetical protein